MQLGDVYVYMLRGDASFVQQCEWHWTDEVALARPCTLCTVSVFSQTTQRGFFGS